MTGTNLEALLDDPRSYLHDPDPSIRRLALSVCATQLARPATREAIAALLADTDGAVRAEAVAVMAEAGEGGLELVLGLRDDPDERVVEAVATALGEIAAPSALDWLSQAVTTHPDRLVREAAVASLGEIGDPRAIPVLLDVLANGPPQVRRRAVAALTVFDDPAIEPALRKATRDRNPMVREVAEMVVGRATEDWTAVELTQSPHPQSE